jgi:non-specific serine/threonine protein kinase
LLRQYRTAAGLTQEELAERALLSPRGLAYLEGGTRSPHRATVRQLADALQLDTAGRAALESAARELDPESAEIMPRALAAPLIPIVGREQDEAAALGLLRRREVRVLTLTGTGGVGKTRLALRVAERLGPELADGVAAVALETIRAPELVMFAIARSLGVREQHGKPLIQSMVVRLRESELLLLLDNFEQVLGAAPLVFDLLSAAPTLKVLVTSRAPLKIAGEHELIVTPLAVPDPRSPYLRDIERSSAVALFVQRAQAVRHSFTITEANATAVADICRRLDGLPLAVELAAARVRVLSVEQLAARLNDGLQLTGSPTAPGRHRTLHATLGWSHDLLPEPERTLFRRLAVFAGGWMLDAAEAVGACPEIVELLGGLIDQSLVVAEENGAAMRYRLLEPVREYAHELLADSGDLPGASQRHAEHFLSLAELAQSKLAGGTQADWLDRLEQEHANLRAALRWLVDAGDPEGKGLRLARALWRYWWLRSYSTEGRAQLAAFLDLAGAAAPAASRSQGLHALGMLALRQGDTVEARNRLEAALSVAHQAEDWLDMAVALTGLGRLALDDGRIEEAGSLLEKSIALERKLGPWQSSSLTLTYLGWVAMFTGDHERAEALLREGLARSRQVGDRDGEARVLWSLGHLALQLGQYETSHALFADSLRIDVDLSYKQGIAIILEGLGDLAAAQQQAERALRLAGAGSALREAAGMVAPVEFRLRHARRMADARSLLEPKVADANWAEGQALALTYVLEEALSAN